MTDEQKTAYIISQSAGAIVEAILTATAEITQRGIDLDNKSAAIIKKYGIDASDVLYFLCFERHE